jgi:hypothetical protein
MVFRQRLGVKFSLPRWLEARLLMLTRKQEMLLS